MKRVPALAVLLALWACTTPQDVPSTRPFQEIDFSSGAYHVLVDDMDGDGRADLAFTSHGGNFTQVFYQKAPRRFHAGPRVTLVGFHPDDLVRLPGTPRRYLMNAEGASSLLVLEPDGRDGLRLVSHRPHRFPQSAAVFRWPGWGLGLAVRSYDGRLLTLLADFDPGSGEVSRAVQPPQQPGKLRPAGPPAVADLDGDGVPEIYYAAKQSYDLWRIRAPAAGADPAAERIWRFEGHSASLVFPFDVDADGILELVIPHATGRRVSVLRRGGDDRFRLVTERHFPLPADFASPPGAFSADVGADRDGNRYLAVGTYGYLVLIRFAANGSSIESLTVPVAGWPSQVRVADVDGDGAVDLVAGMKSFGSPAVVVYGPLWQSMGELVRSGAKLR